MGGAFGKTTIHEFDAQCQWCGGPQIVEVIGQLYPHVVDDIQENVRYIPYHYSVDWSKPKALLIKIWVQVQISKAYKVFLADNRINENNYIARTQIQTNMRKS